jgi:diguanylate cyclase (GGDEF)-like protein
LRALWELSLDRQTHGTQIEGLLEEARSALQCDYAELWDEQLHERTARDGDNAPNALGSLLLSNHIPANEDITFVLEPGEQAHIQALLRNISRSAVLVRRFEAGHGTYALLFAWDQRRARFISEAEKQYLDFLAHVVSRVLVLADKQRELHERVSIDPLTGLHNRSATIERIGQLLSSAKRSASEFAVLYVDLNGFKQVNDSYGHALGDRAITEAAQRMRSVLRRHEVAGRIGGDEFAVLVDFESAADLEAVAKRLMDAVAEPMSFDGVRLRLTASVGIATFPQHADTADELLSRADTAMYAAKRANRTHYAFYDPHSMVRRPAPVHEETTRPFVFCFQPIVDGRTSRIVAAEALIRWFDPAHGLILPGGLDDGAMPAHIDRLVVETLADRDYRQTLRLMPIHVNVSEADDDLLGHIAADAGIVLEIPEALVSADRARFAAFIDAARKRGLRTGLSNFGAAGLPLRFLATLPIDFIKIGKMSPAAARAAIQQAHHFGWTVIAESVEDELERERLVNAGADALQGYHICSPLTHRDFTNWLRYRMVK